jgi:hypothetical protein
MIPDLKTLQRMMLLLIANPSGAPSDAGSMIVGDRHLDARARIEIYSSAYIQRLLAVMREDFPATVVVLGDETFGRVVREYLAAYPPGEPTVFGVGRALPRFLREHHEIEKYVADLAALERLTIEVFHGPYAPALNAEAMSVIAPERWAPLKMRTHPALKLIDCDYEVGPLLRAIAEGGAWTRPPAARSSIVVWRQDAQVFYRTLEPGERAALALAAGGATFAEICATASEKIEGDAVETINRMLARWLSDGLFEALA